MSADACVKCGAALLQPTTGRRRRYCSVTCRRAAEYELRRVQAHLLSAEREAQRWERALQGIDFYGSKDHAAKVLGSWREQIDQLESRLRELLDDAEPERLVS